MPTFSIKSMSKLSTAERDLQTIMQAAVKVVDFSVIYGHRSIEEQQALFSKGRETSGSIVTYCDGVEKKSKHNYSPSKAVDIIPYPSGWKDEERFSYVAGVIMTVADRLLREGLVENRLEWGGNWSRFKDRPHFQLAG
jgi:peptidoglycan L-alanyl-D-glutamate endopeptidase CwlK